MKTFSQRKLAVVARGGPRLSPGAATLKIANRPMLTRSLDCCSMQRPRTAALRLTIAPYSFVIIILAVLNFFLVGAANGADATVARLTDGWKRVPFQYVIQHPYDLDVTNRYQFDPANNVHHFWVYFTDKPHAPPPNATNARTEMRLPSYNDGEWMFDGDVNISPGTFACIAQVFDQDHGPVVMVIAHPDGTVTVGHTVIAGRVIGQWWNLKMTNDTREGGKIKIYVNDELKDTYANRGPRDYYFKCGVYSRTGSERSDVRYRNVKMWTRPDEDHGGKPAGLPYH